MQNIKRKPIVVMPESISASYFRSILNIHGRLSYDQRVENARLVNAYIEDFDLTFENPYDLKLSQLITDFIESTDNPEKLPSPNELRDFADLSFTDDTYSVLDRLFPIEHGEDFYSGADFENLLRQAIGEEPVVDAATAPQYASVYVAYDDVNHSHYVDFGASQRTSPEANLEAFNQSLHANDPVAFPFRSYFSYDVEEIQKFGQQRIAEHAALIAAGETEKASKKIIKSGQPSLSGYSGGLIDAELFTIDIDSKEDLEYGRKQAVALCEYLRDLEVDYQIWFSGSKGFHVDIHKSVIGYKASETLPAHTRRFARALCLAASEHVSSVGTVKIVHDAGLYKRNGKIRLPGSVRKDGRKKILISLQALYRFTPQDIGGVSYQFTQEKIRERLPVYTIQPINPLLAYLWKQSEPGPEPVVIHRKTETSEYEDLSALHRWYEARSNDSWITNHAGKEILVIKCPNPNHPDNNPSAIAYKSDGGAFCHSCGSFHVEKVARFAGIHLQRKFKKSKPLSESRQELSDVIEKIFERGENAIVGTPTGTGKTTAVLAAAVKFDKKLLFMGDNHGLLGEVHGKLGEGNHLNSFYREEPRCIELEGDREGSLMISEYSTARTPTRYEEIVYRETELGLSKAPVCKTCPLNPISEKFDPEQEPCKYMEKLAAIKEFIEDASEVDDDFFAQFEEREQKYLDQRDHLFVAKHYVKFPNRFKEFIKGRDVVVLDEDSLDLLHSIDEFPVSEFASYLKSTKKITLQNGSTVSLGEFLTALVNRNEILGRDSEAIYDAILDSSARGVVTDDFENHIDENGFLGLHVLGISPTVTKLLNTLRQPGIVSVRTFLRHGRTKDSQGQTKHYTRQTLSVESIAQLPSGPQYIYLDASADKFDIARVKQFIPNVSIHNVHAENKKTELIHDPSSAWSISAQDRALSEWTAASGKKRCETRLGRLVSYIQGMEGRVAIIAQKQSPIRETLLEQCDIDEENFLWFGALRGIDRFKGFENLVIIGDPSLPLAAYDSDRHRARIEGELLERGTGYVDPDDYYSLNFETWIPQEDAGEYFFGRRVRDELTQAVGRARGVAHDVKIHLFSTYSPTDRDSYMYRLRPYIVTPKSAGVGITDDERMLVTTVNLSGKSLRTLSEELGLDRRTLSKYQIPAIQDQLEKSKYLEAERLKIEGKTQEEISDLLKMNRTTLRKLIRRFETKIT